MNVCSKIIQSGVTIHINNYICLYVNQVKKLMSIEDFKI